MNDIRNNDLLDGTEQICTWCGCEFVYGGQSLTDYDAIEHFCSQHCVDHDQLSKNVASEMFG